MKKNVIPEIYIRSMKNAKLKKHIQIPKKSINQTTISYINDLVEIYKIHVNMSESTITRKIIGNLNNHIAKYLRLLRIKTIVMLKEQVREYERVEWEIEMIHTSLLINN